MLVQYHVYVYVCIVRLTCVRVCMCAKTETSYKYLITSYLWDSGT